MNAQKFLIGITILNVLMATIFSTIGIVAPHLIVSNSIDNPDSEHIFALYAAARTVPLAIIAIVTAYRQESLAFNKIAALAGVIQLLDGLIGIVQHDLAKTIGPFVLGILTLFAVGQVRTKADTTLQE
jgi:hypothetical protein